MIAVWLAAIVAPQALASTQPPVTDETFVIKAGFLLFDINEIEESKETFEFEGALVLNWQDPREAFDPVSEGADERVFKGSFQLDEVFDGWRPQVMLANQSGNFNRQGVVLRIEPDGTVWYVEEFDASAESPMDMRRFPFDKQTLQLHFKLLGYGSDEVRFEPVADHSKPLPQQGNPVGNAAWTVDGYEVSAAEELSAIAGPGITGKGSTLQVNILTDRRSGFVLRTVVLPLALIIALSWVIFWMDRESISDRLDISFIALLTVVAFQIMVEQAMPAIPAFTVMAGFLAINYILMAATILVTLRVDRLDRTGRRAEGDQLDRRCRWLFPALYFVAGPLLLFAVAAL